MVAMAHSAAIASQSSHDPDPAVQTQSALPAAAIQLDKHPVVALTFDDLPAAGSLPPGENRTKIATALTAELRAAHLEGTYGFINAVKLEKDPDAQQALHIWVDAGMNLGSHTWSHISLTDNSAEDFEKEIALNEPALAQYAGTRDWHWFRYPFLWEGDTLEKRHAVRAYLQEHGYRTAQVTLDFEDYAWNDAYGRCSATGDTAAIAWLEQSYLATAHEYIALGRKESVIVFGHEIPNVMLMHATAFTTRMLPKLIDQLRSEGFRFAALPEVEKDPAYAQDPDAPLKYGGTLPDQFMDSRHLKYPPFAPKPCLRLPFVARGSLVQPNRPQLGIRWCACRASALRPHLSAGSGLANLADRGLVDATDLHASPVGGARRRSLSPLCQQEFRRWA
jgi:peptidoglycan/xylan/chitin deacetylase (PgdA/CDA1 family)